MKKIYALLLILNGITFGAFALSGGPDAYGYTWRDSNDPNGPVYNWIDILGDPNTIDVKPLSDDNTVGGLQIGFPFHYYWYDVTQVWVGSNGYIAFGNDLLASPFYAIPNLIQPQNFVAAMLSDLNFDGVGNQAQCWLWRNPGNDTCVITWLNVPFWQVNAPYYTGSNTFQIILTSTDSSITFQYQQQSGLTSGTAINYMAIGIENISGSVGLQVLHDPPNLGGYYINSNYAIKYYYPPTTTYIAHDAEAHWTDNDISGGIFLSKGTPTPYQMTAAVKNTGNINTIPFNVNCRILNISNSIVAQDNTTVPLLTPAQVQVLTMSNTFNPNTVGSYKMITTTSLAGDSVPSNNIDSLEIVVVDTSQLNIRLSYDNNGPANGPGLNWNGGNGGAGVQFVPPFFPCRVKQLHFFIVSNTASVGFAAKLYGPGGPNGTPGGMLDSVWVPGTSVVTGTWNNVILANPITIDSLGFFVSWSMGGANIILGENIDKPISNRTFEVLANTWAIYRFRQTNDLMINATIERDPTVAVEAINDIDNKLFIYPNPATNELIVRSSEFGDKIELVEIYDAVGQLIFSQQPIARSQQLTIDVSKFEKGMYLCRIKTGEAIITRKISVAR